MIKRTLKENIIQQSFHGQVLIIQGPRQAGKTTLALDIAKTLKGKGAVRIFNCDDPDHRALLENRGLEALKSAVGPARVLFIDEGQKLSTIGQTLKLLADYYKKNLQVVVTGSSAIHLLDKTQESLTGRKKVYTLYPVSLEEISQGGGVGQRELEPFLVYGSYPKVVTAKRKQDKVDILRELKTSYLYRDVFDFQGMKNADVFMNLVKALAYQIGNEVSYRELSNLLKISYVTVERYVHILEQSFIVFHLPVFTRNKRRELSRLRKIYFYDVGIRNAVINNFTPLNERDDLGALWENFMVVERMKYREYHRIEANQYFWRTYDGSEVDLVEERGGRLYGYEFKWKPREHPRVLAKWNEYKGSSYQVITPGELRGFVQ
ncbi:MAG: ATP-binding protein [Candidatus Omnitrophica bacterium]|nr:ATP-binding protein [Candidatus Omnitrophota bacterium]